MAEGEKKKKRRGRALITLYLMVIVALYLIIYIYPKVTGALTSTVTLTYGSLKISDDITGYVVRQEQVYTAQQGGAVNYYVPEGTMTRRGVRVLDVQPTGGAIKSYACPQNGIVSYYIDGEEAFFTPDTMASLTEKQAGEHGDTPENTMRASALSEEPLYKLVQNDVWYVLFWVESGEIADYQVDAEASLELPLDNIKGTIANIVQNDDKWLVILKFDKYYEDMPKLRKIEATVVTEEYEGLVVPSESLATEDNRLGVYVRNVSGGYDFTPVKVVTTDGENSLVRDSYFYEEQNGENVRVDTVEVYDEILRSGKP